jgi:WhiB family redox-sensing transcriptional regulator
MDLLDPQPWAADAACREHPELDWFPSRGEAHTSQKAVCSGCLVRDECLAYAMATGVTCGVWGGTSERERRQLRRIMRREAAA